MPSLVSGSVISGPDSYSWSDHEDLRAVNFNSSGIVAWSVTYTFLDGPVSAGDLVLGVFGLGRIDLDSPGQITTATVAQNGTFLGEWGPANFGPNAFTSGVGAFGLQNALPGDLTPGNPAFNSKLAIVRIDDTVSSLTVNFNQIGQDGVNVTLGSLLIPAPGAAVLLGLGGLMAARRRR